MNYFKCHDKVFFESARCKCHILKRRKIHVYPIYHLESCYSITSYIWFNLYVRSFINVLLGKDIVSFFKRLHLLYYRITEQETSPVVTPITCTCNISSDPQQSKLQCWGSIYYVNGKWDKFMKLITILWQRIQNSVSPMLSPMTTDLYPKT